ncbi:sigma-E factor negative regulatory protein [Isoalcanivorax indicus]|uniref:sigma-E factor negative regulatory protein n=1 Tax=Isoalcanivorax indicus TaxID=2202653 RepID=UPI000DB92C21|nr:sigma-E factor negative regulatory protein [Isoalcanivorax indicus]
MSTERERELLSSLLDGETSELETRRILRDLDDTGAALWQRWQLAGDVARKQPVAAVPADFNARLSAALNAEGRSRNHWLGSIARTAVAASVAAATVTVGWQFWGAQHAGEAPGMVASAPVVESRSRPFGDAFLVGQGLTATPRSDGLRADAGSQINPLMIRHSEMAARHGGQGMVPYARLVSADARQQDK